MSMEVTYKPSAKLLIKFEVKDIKELFQELSPVQEVLEENAVCGKCGATDIRYIHRVAEKFDFYELKCQKCRAKLSLGQNSEGNLFPRKYHQDPVDPKKPLMKDGKVQYMKNNGWSIYGEKE